jgi:spore germination protein YaaH
MKHLLVPLLVVTALLDITPAIASSSPSPAPASDAAHPIASQQIARSTTASPTSVAKPASTSVSAAVSLVPNGLQREVFGFALASSLSDPTVGYPTWNFSLLRTVAFFGLHISDNGAIASDSGLTVWNSAQLTNLLATAHSHGSRVVLTIIEQDFSAGTPHMCGALANRATTVSQTVAQVSAKGVDGVNIDFEGLNGTCPNGQSARSMMTALAHQLRAALPTGSYLSVDTYASSAADPLGFFDIAGLSAPADAFFVMAYDLEYSNYGRTPLSCSTFCLGPTAPLAGYYYNDTTTARQYTAVVPASKVILGVPYYGRKSCVASVTSNASPTGSVTADTYLDASTEAGSPEVQAGSYATHRDANDPSGKERWDTWFNTTLNCTRELYWDDTVSLGLKYDLVNQDGLRGVGIWNLNYGGGAPELWNELSIHFVGCTNAATSASVASPQVSGVPVNLTATSGNCSNPLYEFWLLAPGGTWTLAQPYSASTTFSWATTRKPAGTYRFSVWARDAQSRGTFGSPPNTYDTFSAFDYTLTTAPCNSMTASSSPAGTTSVGTTVTITGAASGCPNPLYEFWILPPGGTWRLAHSYFTSSTLTWTTAGMPAGSYRFSVWARDASSRGTIGIYPNGYDAFAAFQYSLTTSPCTAMTAFATPPSTTAVGTTVTITGNASGCPDPFYEIWILPPGGTWTLAKPYSTSSTFTWTTTAKPAGSYRFSVWARDASSNGSNGISPNTYDSFSAFQYTLT